MHNSVITVLLAYRKASYNSNHKVIRFSFIQYESLGLCPWDILRWCAQSWSHIRSGWLLSSATSTVGVSPCAVFVRPSLAGVQLASAALGAALGIKIIVSVLYCNMIQEWAARLESTAGLRWQALSNFTILSDQSFKTVLFVRRTRVQYIADCIRYNVPNLGHNLLFRNFTVIPVLNFCKKSMNSAGTSRLARSP